MKKSLAVILGSLFIMAMSTSLVAAAEQDTNTNTKSSNKSRKVSKLIDSGHSEIVQAKIIHMRQDYRQLRYGRLSSLETNDSEYQTLLKQLKKDARELF